MALRADGPPPAIAGNHGPLSLRSAGAFAGNLPALRAGFVWNDSDYVTAPALQSVAGFSRIWYELGATEQYYPLLHSVEAGRPRPARG